MWCSKFSPQLTGQWPLYSPLSLMQQWAQNPVLGPQINMIIGRSDSHQTKMKSDLGKPDVSTLRNVINTPIMRYYEIYNRRYSLKETVLCAPFPPILPTSWGVLCCVFSPPCVDNLTFADWLSVGERRQEGGLTGYYFDKSPCHLLLSPPATSPPGIIVISRSGQEKIFYTWNNLRL